MVKLRNRGMCEATIATRRPSSRHLLQLSVDVSAKHGAQSWVAKRSIKELGSEDQSYHAGTRKALRW